MADLDPALVKAIQTIAFNLVAFSDKSALSRRDIEAMLRVLPLSTAALNALARGEASVVPKVPTGDMIEAHQSECAGDADEAGPARIRSAYAAMLAASPYAAKE